jgi:hypothetical protein
LVLVVVVLLLLLLAALVLVVLVAFLAPACLHPHVSHVHPKARPTHRVQS